MNTSTAVFQFTMAHPNISAVVALAALGGIGYGVVKLTDKVIDAAGSIAGHAIDHAIENQYSFEFSNASIRVYPQAPLA